MLVLYQIILGNNCFQIRHFIYYFGHQIMSNIMCFQLHGKETRVIQRVLPPEHCLSWFVKLLNLYVDGVSLMIRCYICSQHSVHNNHSNDPFTQYTFWSSTMPSVLAEFIITSPAIQKIEKFVYSFYYSIGALGNVQKRKRIIAFSQQHLTGLSFLQITSQRR